MGSHYDPSDCKEQKVNMNRRYLKELRFTPFILLADSHHEVLNAYFKAVDKAEV
jgi:hypothetical protein